MVEGLKSAIGLSDVTLACSGFTTRTHKLVLASASEFFRNLFEKFSDSKHPTIVVTEVDPATLKLIVDFLYSGCIDIPYDKLDSLIEAAHLLEIKVNRGSVRASHPPVQGSILGVPKKLFGCC